MKIQMVDLVGQYNKIEQEINTSILNVIKSGAYINGPEVNFFRQNLQKYLKVNYVIPCANGTDALQIALMALGLKPGDEVIIPAFTYAATAEVALLLGLTIRWAEVDPLTFNLNPSSFAEVITTKTKAVIPVHLYGQCANMEEILNIARENNIYVIEDSAQSIGAEYYFSDGSVKKAGTMGDIGCTSFFPTKNLGCYGDGGAIFTNNYELSVKIEMISNHGQVKKYYHEIVGVNSRLDTIQASILDIKLEYLNDYNLARNNAAIMYDSLLSKINEIQIPFRCSNSTHVYHQYTILIKNGTRDDLRNFLAESGIPTMIYYPVPLYGQNAYFDHSKQAGSYPISDMLSNSVLSLPMHTEMNFDMIKYISLMIETFYS
jgi:UDP-2-acetamido-2-deoxy-ribo-hexuluronate aminotransferase